MSNPNSKCSDICPTTFASLFLILWIPSQCIQNLPSEEEMRSFLGIHLAMGLVRLPSLKDYWSTNPLLATPGIVKGMSRNRLRSIHSHLHINNNSQMPRPGSPNFNKLFKLRPLLNKICLNSQAAYQLHQQGAFQG